jgi:fatty-acyl-CoA synthase
VEKKLQRLVETTKKQLRFQGATLFYGDWLHRRELLSPNKITLIDALNGNQLISCREWNQQTNQFANILQDELGICKGDRVAIYAKNPVEYLDALFACNKLGTI